MAREKPLGTEVVPLTIPKENSRFAHFKLRTTRTPNNAKMFFTPPRIHTVLTNFQMEGERWGRLHFEIKKDRLIWGNFHPFNDGGSDFPNDRIQGLDKIGIAAKVHLRMAQWMNRHYPNRLFVHLHDREQHNVSGVRRNHLRKMDLGTNHMYAPRDYLSKVAAYIRLEARRKR